MIARILAGKTKLDRLILALSVVGIVVGLKYGFEFGYRIGGMLMAVFVALICAVFCALMVTGVAERLLRKGGTNGQQP